MLALLIVLMLLFLLRFPVSCGAVVGAILMRHAAARSAGGLVAEGCLNQNMTERIAECEGAGAEQKEMFTLAFLCLLLP